MRDILRRLFKGWKHPSEDSENKIAAVDEPLELMDIVPPPSQLLNSITIKVCPAVRIPVGFKNNILPENPFSIYINLDESNLYLNSKEKAANANVKLEDGPASELLCSTIVYEWYLRGLIGINLILTPFKAVEPLEIAAVQTDTALTADDNVLVEASLGYSPLKVPSLIRTQYLWSLQCGIPFLIDHEGREIKAYEEDSLTSSQTVATDFIEALSGQYAEAIHVPITISASSKQIELYEALSRIKSSYSFDWDKLQDSSLDILELLKGAVENSIVNSSIKVKMIFENNSFTARLSKDETAGEVTEIQVVLLNKPNTFTESIFKELSYIRRIKNLLPINYSYEGESVADCEGLMQKLQLKVQTEIEGLLNVLDSKLYLSSLTPLGESCLISVEEGKGSLTFDIVLSA